MPYGIKMMEFPLYSLWRTVVLLFPDVTVWVKGERQTADLQRMDAPVLQRD